MREFIFGLGKHVKKEYKTSLLIFNMDIFGLMVYVQQVEEDKRKDREEHLSKRAKSDGHDLTRNKVRVTGHSFIIGLFIMHHHQQTYLCQQV